MARFGKDKYLKPLILLAREITAKPLFSGSNPDAASSYSTASARIPALRKIPGAYTYEGE